MYKQGDIVFVPFPYSEDHSISKQRPVAIISKNEINKNSYITAKISTVLKNDYTVCLSIFKNDVDFEMQKPSEIRTNEIMTIDKSIIIKKLGALKKSGLEKLLNMVQDHFSIE